MAELKRCGFFSQGREMPAVSDDYGLRALSLFLQARHGLEQIVDPLVILDPAGEADRENVSLQPKRRQQPAIRLRSTDKLHVGAVRQQMDAPGSYTSILKFVSKLSR